MPIHIFAENRNSSSSFLLSKDHVCLKNKSTTGSLNQGARTEGEEASAGGHILVGAGAVLVFALPVLSPILLFPGIKMLSDAEVIKCNLVTKELQTKTVSPGKSVEGFVYFKLPTDSTSLKDWYLLIKATDITRRVSHEFELSLE